MTAVTPEEMNQSIVCRAAMLSLSARLGYNQSFLPFQLEIN
jgi:hypothetical protein